MDREFDIIVYGASGLASKYIIKKLLTHNISLGLSGRSRKNIEENIREIENTSEIPIFEANPTKPSEIDTVTSKTRILINCAGPYVYSGEQIVESCLKNNTHYFDVSGETYFIERCIQRFNKEAESKNIYVINCAGFDSVPADIGVEYLKENILQECKSKNECDKIEIESVLVLKNCCINKATYDSAVYGFGKKNETSKLRKVHHEKSNVTKRKIKKLFYNDELKSYCGIFLGTDASVVKRTQQRFVKENMSVPCQYSAFVKLGSFFKTGMVVGSGLIFYLLALSSFGRWVLLKFPRIFTLNCIKKRRPTEKEIEKGSFEFRFRGKCGDVVKRMKVSGPDPGYITTAICVTECAMLLLEILGTSSNESDSEDIKFKGGVLTPGLVFSGSDLVERLNLNGIKFEIEE